MAEIEGQPQPRRSFTEEFKREAVRLAVERGNVSAVARDLGVHESVLNRWKRRLQQEVPQPGSSSRPFPGNGNPRDEVSHLRSKWAEELAKLQRELARVKQENEILKKASEAIFDGRVGIFTSRPHRDARARRK